MGTTLPGGYNDVITAAGPQSVNVYGNSIAVTAINSGSDAISLTGAGSVTAANTGADTISLTGPGLITALNTGNDSISLQGSGSVSALNTGNDTITVGGNVSINAGSGNYVTNVGPGNDTIVAAGHATVKGVSGSTFAGATLIGGSVQIVDPNSVTDVTATGTSTLIGAASATYFTASGNDSITMTGVSGKDTFVGGSGHDTMISSGNANVFEFLSSNAGGTHVITNFTSNDQLYVEGLSYAQVLADVSYLKSPGNTVITLDGGKTTIELTGIHILTINNITTTKT